MLHPITVADLDVRGMVHQSKAGEQGQNCTCSDSAYCMYTWVWFAELRIKDVCFSVFHLRFISQILSIKITNKMRYKGGDIFYSQFSQHVSAAIAVIFRVMLLLQEYKFTKVVSCVTITP